MQIVFGFRFGRFMMQLMQIVSDHNHFDHNRIYKVQFNAMLWSENEEDFESNKIDIRVKTEKWVKYGRYRVAANSAEIDDDFVTDHIAYSGQSFESGPQH